MTPDISNLKDGGASIVAKSSILWCLPTGMLSRPNPIEGNQGIVVRGSELCLRGLNGVQRYEAVCRVT